MQRARPSERRHRHSTAIDIVVILALSFLTEAVHFSYQQGRAVICGDSAQYVASAEALLGSDRTAHFEMRKPGYILFLAGVSLVFGNMGWAAVVCNHAMLATLPLAAYGLGRNLRGRGVGWLGAFLTIAQLQLALHGNRMMSEALFVCLFSFGLLVFSVGLSRANACRWMLGGGTLLGLAWLTRGSATPAIAGAVVAILWTMREDWRRALLSCVWFGGPIVCCFLVECGLNLRYADQFRPSSGTAGMTLLLRARQFQGAPLPETPDGRRVLALLPERNRDSAYVANLLDVWVARHRAVHGLGMSEWEFDNLMRRVALDALATDFGAYVKSGLHMAACHLLRQPKGQRLSPIPDDRRAHVLIHPAAPSEEEGTDYWFAYWGLPHMPLNDSIALVERMKATAAKRAPFGDWRMLSALRYWKTKPAIEQSMASLVWLGGLWPGFALIGFAALRLERRTCAFLVVAYVLDALFIGFLTPTTQRLQFIWIMTDTTLAASLVVVLVGVVVTRVASAVGRPCPAQRRPATGAAARLT